VITCTLTMNNQEIPTHVLINSGATGIALMHQDFARHYQIPLLELQEKRQLELLDGSPIKSGDITHIANVGMTVKDHKEQLPMVVTKLGHYPIVPGLAWLRLHDVVVRFASNMVTFGSQFCTTHYHDAPITVQGVTAETPKPVSSGRSEIFEPPIHLQRHFRGCIVMVNGSSFFRTVKKGKIALFTLSLYNINTAIEAKDLKE